MNYLSTCLSAEYAEQGILVQTVTPGQVETNLSKILYDPKLAVSAHDYVWYALRAVGAERETSAHPKHKRITALMLVMTNLLGRELFLRVMLRLSKSLREKIHKKMQQAQQKEEV